MRRASAKGMLIGVALLGLVGCDKLGVSGSGEGNGSATAVDDEAGEKLNAYIDGYNALLDSGGLERQARDYRDSNIPNGTAAGDFRVDPGWINQGLDKLRAARKLPGGVAAIDAAADTVIASIGKVETHLASLKPYYSGKQYLDDNFARGKAENATMLAEIETAEKDLMAFGKALDEAMTARETASLQKLKSSDPLGYNVKLALIHAKTLLRLFKDESALGKSGLIARADAEVVIIEKAIADGRAAAGQQGAGAPQAFDLLTSMIGAYREFKQDKDPGHLSTMLSYYNGAVNDANN